MAEMDLASVACLNIGFLKYERRSRTQQRCITLKSEGDREKLNWLQCQGNQVIFDFPGIAVNLESLITLHYIVAAAMFHPW